MASDMINTEDGLIIGNNIALSLNFDNTEEMQAIFDKLSQGAKVAMPLKQEFLGIFGQFTDKYGIKWMFNQDMTSNQA